MAVLDRLLYRVTRSVNSSELRTNLDATRIKRNTVQRRERQENRATEEWSKRKDVGQPWSRESDSFGGENYTTSARGCRGKNQSCRGRKRGDFLLALSRTRVLGPGVSKRWSDGGSLTTWGGRKGLRWLWGDQATDTDTKAAVDPEEAVNNDI